MNIESKKHVSDHETLDIKKYKNEPLGWESEKEWDIECQAFQACCRSDVPKDVQDLIRVLWWQYCLHADPEK